MSANINKLCITNQINLAKNDKYFLIKGYCYDN